MAQNLSRQFPHKIIVQYDHVDTNSNQITHLVNDRILATYPKPNLLIFIEWVEKRNYVQSIFTKRLYRIMFGGLINWRRL